MKKYLLSLLVMIGSIGLSAQDVTVYKTFDEFEHVIQADDDQVYVVNFWATWCAPCVRELPYFDELNAKYADKGVKVTLVSLDFLKTLDSRLKPFLEKKKLKSDVVLLGDSKANNWIDRVNPDWDGSIPATLIFDKKNRVFLAEEFESMEDIEKHLAPFLNK